LKQAGLHYIGTGREYKMEKVLSVAEAGGMDRQN
jgi:hypothetical protein